MARITGRALSKRVLRGEAEPESVLAHPTEWYAENGADLRTGERVASLDDVDADTIVVATGARPRPLPGALPLRTVDDSLTLRERAQAAGSVVVVGGGFIGCEVTASLTVLGVEVTQIVRDPHLFSVLQAPALSEVIEARYREHGVDLRLGETEIPDAPLTVAGIGVEPNVELAPRRRARGEERRHHRRALRHVTPGCLRDRRRGRVLRPRLRAPPADRALVERGLPRHDARPHPRRLGRALRHRLVASSPSSSAIPSSSSAT